MPGKGGNKTVKTTEYLDGFQYSLTESVAPCLWCFPQTAFENGAYMAKGPVFPEPVKPVTQLDFVSTTQCFYSYTENRYIYHYKDHLGNTRVSFAKKTDGSVEITYTNDYYPFGLNHIGSEYKGYLGSYYNYKYNSEEIQETGMYDYGARIYMPDIGRWRAVDPLAKQYQSISSYAYVANNPINAIDPDGRDIIFIGGNRLQLQYRKGNFYYLNGDLKGQKYDGRNQRISTTLFSLAKSYRKIEHSNDKVLIGMLHKLETSENTHLITDNKEKANQVDIYRKGSENNYEGDGTLTNFNFNDTEKGDFKKSEGIANSDLSIVTHEMQHQYDYEIGNTGDHKYKGGQTAKDL